MSNHWTYQYASLNYVNNDAFFGIMEKISMKELQLAVSSLPNNKTAGLSDITNELWKHSRDKMTIEYMMG
ncbi:hypothetical protein G9A89_012452 [Geosiphon pyriformis]|nr:hypothetical protein G9A89_012452 [Geosiphon pyriformis]